MIAASGHFMANPSPSTSRISTPALTIEASPRAPAGFQYLVWNVFFASRGRGVTLHAHFPWLDRLDQDTCYVLATRGQAVVGGLALRSELTPFGRIGTIGLVCVHPDHRGEGISTSLLDVALATARSQGLAALRLWTQKPGVYARVGFEIADLALYGSIRHHPLKWQGGSGAVGPQPTRHDVAASFGIPPFAAGVEQVRSGDASLTLILDERGPIVSEWQGGDERVADLLAQVLPAEARFNAFADQSLLEVLTARGWELALTPSRLQMILPLDDRSAIQWAASSRVPVTNRL